MNLQETKSLIWTLLALLFVRAFVAEPYKIPSGSMIPTLLVGDHILVSKSSYDLRIPFTDIQFLKVASPKRGDVVVFKYPNYEADPSKNGIFFIKRLIGLPGDVISIDRGIITINGQKVARQNIDDPNPFPPEAPNYYLNRDITLLAHETLPDMSKPHLMQHYKGNLYTADQALNAWQLSTGKSCVEVGKAYMRGYVSDPRLMNSLCEFTVPKGEYFFMGDNRDDSSDSRFWGFVPHHYIKGKALFIWLPWKSEGPYADWSYNFARTEGEGGPLFRWSRMALRIQ